MSKESFKFRASEMIAFEAVDIRDAMEKPPSPAADDGIDADRLSINFGRRKDSKPTAVERMLAGSAMDWLMTFSAGLRPKAMCDRYPHVANRLAQGWSDRARSMQSLQALVDDVRWGSPGFPGQVQDELKRLLATLIGGAAAR